MNPPSILILTSAHLCRNPRVVKEATTLGNAGYDVTVMSISVSARFEAMDQTIMRNAPFKRVVLDYYTPSRRVRLADFFQRTATWAARNLCRQFKWETAQALGPASALLRLARKHPADLTIVHTEIPIWIAPQLIRDGRRVAVDVEDWYSEDLLCADRQSRPTNLLKRSEAAALNGAAYTSATSESMSEALANAYGCPRPIVIRNSFPRQDRPRTAAPANQGKPRFIWFSQTIGPGRGLELFFAAWARTKTPSEVYLLGDERRGYREQILARLPAHRRGDVHFLPLVSPEQLPIELAKFDVGLALESRRPLNRDITITNKILQYMNAGLAIVATDTAGQIEVMKAEPNCGLLITAHETGDYAASLDHLIGNPSRLRAAQLAARAAAEREFCWERETPRLLAAVEAALAHSSK
jgi:glycosyltransferase involved in cell wall biosynthesis